jgi:hypothetical protein
VRGALAPLLTAAVLLVGLVVVHDASGADQPPRLAYRGEAPVHDLTTGADHDELEDVFYTPEITVDRPSRLTLELTREATTGWFVVTYALVDLDSGDVREGVAEPGAREAIVLDRVAPGRYVVRLLAAWDPRGTVERVAAPDTVGVRVSIGGRPAYELWVLATLLLLPALAGFVRARTRRPAGGAPSDRVDRGSGEELAGYDGRAPHPRGGRE